jgi:tripartite-type tricarboxylate transporter receptor subunit TctC
MKKVIALVLALIMVFGLAACGNGGGSNNNQAEAPKWPDGDVTLFFPYDESSLTAVNATTMADWIREQTGKKAEVEYNKTANGWNLAEKLLKADADGLTLMVVGLDALTGYVKGDWKNAPFDTTKFQIVTGFTQPYPYSGCMLITQADAPYNNWAELEAYAKANPDTVNVADRAGSIMTTKLKSLFNQTGLSKYVHWTPATSDSVKTGIDPANKSINIAIFDETSAAKYLQQPDKYKAIINCRADNDFSYYAADTNGLDLISKVPTLLDVFGKEKAEQYNVPNTTAIICRAEVPAEVVKQIKEVCDKLGTVEKSDDDTSFYKRQRVNGGTSKYYTWPSEDIQKEWQRLEPVIREIEGK